MITAARNPDVWARAQYFPIKKNWRRLGPIFRSPEAERIWRPCMIERDQVHREDHKLPPSTKDPSYYQSPSWYDGCDWRYERRGKWPELWEFACHAACHWVVDLGLYVAKVAYPNIPWRILTARHHTTVWNGCVDDPVLFDINFYSMGIEPNEAMKLASKGRELKVGRYLKGYLHGTK